MIHTTDSLRASTSRRSRRRTLGRAVAATCEQLEDRRLLSGVTFAAGTLTVVGTEGDDTVSMVTDDRKHDTLLVTLNDTTRSFALADVKHIVVKARGGDDVVLVNESYAAITADAFLSGGDGADLLVGGSGDDVIYGGAGRDTLVGAEGDDTLLGGGGNDRVLGQDGADLVGGGEGDDIISSARDHRADHANGNGGDDQVDTKAVEATLAKFSMRQMRTQFADLINVGLGGQFGYTPSQIYGAYGVDALFNGKYQAMFTNPGQGQTIIIVVPWGDLTTDQGTISTDLASFNTAFGIGGAATFTLVSLDALAGNTGGAANTFGVLRDTTFSLQWAHAMAPEADLIVVEAERNPIGNGLVTSRDDQLMDAVDEAVRQANLVGGAVVELCFGGLEVATDIQFERHFNNANTNLVSFIAPAGDAANAVFYPASSGSVLTVGGTSLDVDFLGDRDSGTETAWAGGAGGTSTVIRRPLQQTGLRIGQGNNNLPPGTAVGNFRVGPDLAFVGDPGTGLAFYDRGVLAVGGGTSAGAPAIAGLVALGNQIRAFKNLAPVGSRLPQMVYAMGRIDRQANFFDITQGNNASVGFDLSTGWGVPNAENFVRGVAGEIAADSKFTANFTYWFRQPILQRAILNMSGLVDFTFTKQLVNLTMVATQDNGATGVITINPLVRRGKSGFAGTGIAQMTKTIGGTQATNVIVRFPIKVNGTVYRDKRGVPHVKGQFVAVGGTVNSKPLTREQSDTFSGKFSG